MTEWKEYKLGDVLAVRYGKDHKPLGNGQYPVYGSGGIMRYADRYLYDKESILIPRKGSLNNIFYQEGPFWTVDTMFWTEIDKAKVEPKFLFYQLTLVDLENLNVGSAVPSLTVPVINDIDITLPPLDEQKRIAGVLSSLDDKIDLLHRENATLEALAETLFRHYFIENPKPDWKEGKLGDYVDIKRGGSPRPITDYIAPSGYRWLKISDVTNIDSPYIFHTKEYIKESGLNKTVLLNAGSLVLSNSATPGIPKILCVDSCIHDGWLYFPKSRFSKYYLYLFFKFIRQDLINLGNGSIFTNLKTDILKNYVINIPDGKKLDIFESIVCPLFEKMLGNTKQVVALETLRNAILPRIMSGELKAI